MEAALAVLSPQGGAWIGEVPSSEAMRAATPAPTAGRVLVARTSIVPSSIPPCIASSCSISAAPGGPARMPRSNATPCSSIGAAEPSSHPPPGTSTSPPSSAVQWWAPLHCFKFKGGHHCKVLYSKVGTTAQCNNQRWAPLHSFVFKGGHHCTVLYSKVGKNICN